MNTAEIILFSFSLLFILGSFGSLLRWHGWWIRFFDFPRMQISTILLVLFATSFVVYNFSEWWHFAIVILIIAGIILQAIKIFRYTPLHKKQVHSYKGGVDPENTISLIISNVLQTNKEVHKLINHVKNHKPDILLTLESNNWWEEQLNKLETDYPYSLKKPLENLYGMHLYSKLELIGPKIMYRVKKDIPSFEMKVKLNKEDILQLYCLHPKPPFPTESKTSLYRDAELLLVGKIVENEDVPTIIAGDFNDVAWSYTTTLFQRVSGLLDPRIGRGFFNTFHAKYPFMRFPLDHIFHSPHFKLIKLKRLSEIGSDHFPIFAKLHLDHSHRHEQNKPDANKEEQEWASETIDDTDPKRKTLN
ncbi:MAG: endonuclease/exonuclease/phosphatase family protein [Tangfeifania sp.]